jgi:hypothetical protein
VSKPEQTTLFGEETKPRCKCYEDPNPPKGARCRLCGRVVPGERAHTCHARGCTKHVKPELLMCGKHWRRVPRKIQRAVWSAYRPGQCDDGHPSKQWHTAADAAIGYVAVLDGETARIKELEALGDFGFQLAVDRDGKFVWSEASRKA